MEIKLAILWRCVGKDVHWDVFSRSAICFDVKWGEFRRADRRRMSSRSSLGRVGFGGAMDLDFEVVPEEEEMSRVLRADFMIWDLASRIWADLSACVVSVKVGEGWSA